MVYDVAIPINAKVLAIIDDGLWAWRNTNTLEVIYLRKQMHLIPFPSFMDDKICWLPERNGLFTTSSAWEVIRDDFLMVPWYSLVWFPKATPRHAFILWLAVNKRQATHDRIQHFSGTSFSFGFFVGKGLIPIIIFSFIVMLLTRFARWLWSIAMSSPCVMAGMSLLFGLLLLKRIIQWGDCFEDLPHHHNVCYLEGKKC